MALHSVHTVTGLSRCTAALGAQDALLILEAEALAVVHEAPIPCPVFYLSQTEGDQATPPNIMHIPAPAVTAVDYHGWVKLCEEHPQQLNWR